MIRLDPNLILAVIAQGHQLLVDIRAGQVPTDELVPRVHRWFDQHEQAISEPQLDAERQAVRAAIQNAPYAPRFLNMLESLVQRTQMTQQRIEGANQQVFRGF